MATNITVEKPYGTIAPVSSTLSLQTLYTPVDDAIGEVRGTMAQLWRDALELVGMARRDTPRVGGKMLRPALCLLSAGALGNRDASRFVSMAAAFEALHIASLAHDDVIDRALQRHGAVSLTGFWDNHAAVLGGDYLVARSVEMLAVYDQCSIIANANSSVRRMAEGELYFFNRPAAQISLDDCIMLAEQKTASLFAEAVSSPAVVLDPSLRKPLHDFGMCLGVAFQLTDDLLDLTQPADTLGKPSCGDVVEGKRTYPLQVLRQNSDAETSRRLDRLQGATLTEADRDWLAGVLDETGACDETSALAHRYIDDAINRLNHLPASAYRYSIEGIAEFVLTRSA